jgi:hypothetical protein
MNSSNESLYRLRMIKVSLMGVGGRGLGVGTVQITRSSDLRNAFKSMWNSEHSNTAAQPTLANEKTNKPAERSPANVEIVRSF